jgi:hypothetical protein
LGVHVTDAVTSNRALVPILDLAQNRLDILSHRALPQAGIDNRNHDGADLVKSARVPGGSERLVLKLILVPRLPVLK